MHLLRRPGRSKRLARHLAENGRAGCGPSPGSRPGGPTVIIKARFANFATVTRAHTATEVIGDTEAIAALLPELLDRAVPQGASVRLLGIIVSGLVQVQAAGEATHQMSLLDEILSPQ